MGIHIQEEKRQIHHIDEYYSKVSKKYKSYFVKNNCDKCYIKKESGCTWNFNICYYTYLLGIVNKRGELIIDKCFTEKKFK